MVLLLRAVTVVEDFSTNPLARDWRVFGDASLFHWNATNQNLEVTWDSSHTNSYYYLPLKTILDKDDDFSLSFDLEFLGYASGTTSNKPYAAEAAIGLLNLDNATQTNFSRGSGVSAAYGPENLVEFDFFPSFSTFLPTIAQVIVSTNNTWLYNHDNLLDMPPGDLFHIEMDYAAATRTLTTVTTLNGSQYGATQTIQVPTNGFDFRVAAFSVSSYSDQNSASSIHAHGVIDNIVVTTPPPPVQNLIGKLANTVWQVTFLGRSNWLYTLERTVDFSAWTNVSATVSGNATNLVLQDTNPPTDQAFYRVRAERP
jgi:hypothetical protein